MTTENVTEPGCCAESAGTAPGPAIAIATATVEPSGTPASGCCASDGQPCCGTQAAAQAANACCDPAAKADAVTAGAGCC